MKWTAWFNKAKGLVPRGVSTIIDTSLCVTLFSLGVYLNSPLYENTADGPVGLALESTISRAYLGALCVLPPLIVFYGYQAHKRRFRHIGVFFVFLSYLFNTIFKAVSGGDPLGWMFTLALCVISAAMFINLKLKQDVD